MRILHVPRRFVASHWGGTETVVLETCRHQIAKGHEARILTSMALAEHRAEEIGGVPVERFPHFYPWLGLDSEARMRLDQKGGNLFSFALLGALRRERGASILHLHTGKRLGGIVRDAARRLRVPYVVSLHGGLLDVPEAEAATFAEPTAGRIEWGKLLGWWVGSRRVLDDAAAILCLGTEELRRVQERFPRTKAVLFPNGVDADRFARGDGPGFRARHGIPADAPLALCVGRIDPQKNQLLAVEAFARVAARRTEARLLLVGHVTSADYERRLRAAIESSGCAERITLLCGLPSSSPDLLGAYHAADAFLLPSIHEPFGVVVLEAWAAGLPVAASRVGGVPSFTEDGVDALLFESGSAEGAAEALDALLGNAERARSIAEAGRRKAVERFSWPRLVDDLQDLYEEAIRANPLRQ